MPAVELIAEKRARIRNRLVEALLSDDFQPDDLPLPPRFRIKKDERKVTITDW